MMERIKGPSFPIPRAGNEKFSLRGPEFSVSFSFFFLVGAKKGKFDGKSFFFGQKNKLACVQNG